MLAIVAGYVAATEIAKPWFYRGRRRGGIGRMPGRSKDGRHLMRIAEADIRRVFHAGLWVKAAHSLLEVARRAGARLPQPRPHRRDRDRAHARRAPRRPPRSHSRTPCAWPPRGCTTDAQSFAAWYLFSHGAIKLVAGRRRACETASGPIPPSSWRWSDSSSDQVDPDELRRHLPPRGDHRSGYRRCRPCHARIPVRAPRPATATGDGRMTSPALENTGTRRARSRVARSQDLGGPAYASRNPPGPSPLSRGPT